MEPVSFLFHIKGPAQAGSGERHQMLERAREIFEEEGWPKESVVRVDVPGRGQSAAGEAAIRPEVEPAVPALQSGSMFLDKTGVMIVDAQQLKASEAQALAELLDNADRELCRAVLVSAGEVAAPLKKAVKGNGQTVSIKTIRPGDASQWLSAAARRHGLRLPKAAADALKEKFGSDLAAMEQALSQLEMAEGNITPEMIRKRFDNRPVAPTWDYTDAISEGDQTKALRFLRNFMTHNHPLVLIAVLENDIRKRALAAAAPHIDAFAAWINSSPNAYPTKKAWGAGRSMSALNLRRAIGVLCWADEILKSKPEETHLVTMERLTVALARWCSR